MPTADQSDLFQVITETPASLHGPGGVRKDVQQALPRNVLLALSGATERPVRDSWPHTSIRRWLVLGPASGYPPHVIPLFLIVGLSFPILADGIPEKRINTLNGL